MEGLIQSPLKPVGLSAMGFCSDLLATSRLETKVHSTSEDPALPLFQMTRNKKRLRCLKPPFLLAVLYQMLKSRLYFSWKMSLKQQ